MSDVPTFSEGAILWGTTTLIQSLIVQLISTKVLSVEDAQRVFDIALQRAKAARETIPDAESAIQFWHDKLDWDGYYKWAAEQKKGPG